MHALHMILVKPNAYQGDEDIVTAAFLETSYALYDAFDYRSLAGARNWFEEGSFPGNVVRQERDSETFGRLLRRARANQLEELQTYEKRVFDAAERTRGDSGASAREVLHAWADDDDPMDIYMLAKYVDLLAGRYVFESHFYDVEQGWARLSDARIEAIEDDGYYALVLADYHI